MTAESVKSLPRRSEESLETLADVLVDSLMTKIKSGEATASDLSVARGLLMDAGIRLIPSAKASRALVKAMPQFEEEEMAAR